MHPSPSRLGRRDAVGLAGALLAFGGLASLAGPAQAAAPAPAACLAPAPAAPAQAAPAHVAPAQVAPARVAPAGVLALGARHFDARTKYGAATGTIDWSGNWFHVSGKLVDTARYSSTSYAYVHWATKYTQGCSIWVEHEARAAKAGNGKTARISFDRGPYAEQEIANVWVQTCTKRNGWTCSPWK